MDPFRVREGTLDLKTGLVTDSESGEEICLGAWTRGIDAEQNTALQKLQRERDITSDIINLPGTKPYFENERGLISSDNSLRTDAPCKDDLGYNGLS